MSKRILIVDDSALIREHIRASLEQHSGWQVCGEAVNGMAALHQARDLRPDLVVLDFSMPVMNGLESARQLRKLMPSLLIVLFTSYASATVQRDAVDAGISEVVSKDSPLACLTETLKRLLQSENPQSTSSVNAVRESHTQET